jgi:predicted ATPase
MPTEGRLDRLKINGYKSLKKIDIEFNNINILIGANGVGKSNFIGFFKFIRKLSQKDLELFIATQGGANRVLHFGRKTTQELEFSILFKPNAYHATLIPDQEDKLIFKNEYAYFYGDWKNTKYNIDNTGLKESQLNSTIPIHKHIISHIKDWQVYHFHDTSKNSPMKQTNDINDYIFLKPNADNLAAFLYFIKKNYEKNYMKIVQSIQRVVPYFKDFSLEPEVANPNSIRLRWFYKGHEDYFDVNDLSDGSIRFICLVSLLLQPNLPTTILLDEPELGLHPYALEVLASIFRVVSNKTQIIASTQSATFADMFEISDIVVVDTVEDATSLTRLDEVKYKEWLDDYSIGELWQKNIIGGNPS